MKYKKLGSTGIEVSFLGLGGIPVQRITKEETVPFIKACFDAGINFIDTAKGYTVSEEYLGNALFELNLRDKFVIATKTMSRTKDAMANDIETSLAAFHTDYIDLYQFHNIKTDADFDTVFSADGAMAALKEAVAAGKVRHIGATAHSDNAFKRLLLIPEIETIMFPYNLVETQGEELIKQCAECGKGFIVMKPLAGGNFEDVEIALRFLAQNENIGTIIPGMATVEELAQNVKAVENDLPLSQDEMLEIEKIRNEVGTDFCRRCGYCAPCEVGIDIPSCFLMEGYISRYNLSDWAKARYGGFAKKASDCIECGKCEKRCPYDLKIREKLKKVAKAFE